MDQIKIGKFIAQLRLEKSLTQEELGEKLGVTNKTISRWENANYMPNIEMLQVMSTEFGVSINELLYGERISGDDYRKKADENIVSLLCNDVFSLDEQCKFWKKKWLKDHSSFLPVFIAIAIAVILGLCYVNKPILNGISAIIGLIVYLKYRNDMLGYMESHIYIIKGKGLL